MSTPPWGLMSFTSSFLSEAGCALRTVGFVSERPSAVQTAFGPGRAAPAPGARVFADADGRRAGRAPDGRVVQIVKRVVGHAVLEDVAPHVARRPGRERVYLDEPELRVTLDDAGPGPRRRLFAADGRDPRAQARERLPQRLDLAQPATLFRVALPQPFTVQVCLRPEREAGRATLEAEAVALAQSLGEGVGLGEEQVRVEVEDAHARGGPREHVDEHAALRPEARGERHLIP